jgi:DNA replication and repair protein RecF
MSPGASLRAVRRVSVRGFRNLDDGAFEPGGAITLVHGPNGAGKSSLLEALVLSLTGHSTRTRREREAIRFDADLARVETEVEAGGETRAFLWSAARSGERRHLLDGSEPGARATDARPPLAIFIPDRLALVKGPPSARRGHLDRLAAALWPARAACRRRYGAALAQRNALLTRSRGGAPDSLDAWDAELAEAAAELIECRATATAALAGEFPVIAAELGLPGPLAVTYRPRCESADAAGIAAELGDRRAADLARGFSTHGPHLDELELTVAGRQVRRYGSQGEQRTALLALLLAEREALIASRSTAPLMLLDDVMSELDPDRRRLLTERLEAGGGQTLITATETGQLPAGAQPLEIALRAGARVGLAPRAAA